MSVKTGPVRRATHAGSWYTDDGDTLNQELSTWLSQVTIETPIKGCKAVIAPHAGYSYSGPAAAWAHKSIDTTGIKRVFILGPSHHLYIQGCGLTRCSSFETPIGDLPVDLDTTADLRSTGKFEIIDRTDDEAEHSLEMMLPYIRKLFEGQPILIVPIIVGSIAYTAEQDYGALLAPYISRDDTICVVSSDFCHWGTRFSYTYYYPDPATHTNGIRLSRSVQPTSTHAIHESIRMLDHEGMDILTLPADGTKTAASTHHQFSLYLSRTKNTICGRHPIGVLLGALSKLEEDHPPEIQWVRYEQSSACESLRDSSVSYASAWIKF